MDVKIFIQLLIQLVVILICSRVCGYVLKKVGQPNVIGEMIAGILLGKSVFGLFWPDTFAAIFPSASMLPLHILSQIGLALFMFAVGIELKDRNLQNRISTAIWVSTTSIVLPFSLGAVLSFYIYKTHGPAAYSMGSFALFMGIAMSITAFPVLARILQEKKLINTRLGSMAIKCAAIDDVAGWCALACILGFVKADSVAMAIGTILASMAYIFVMLKVVQPFIFKLLQKGSFGEELRTWHVGVVLMILLISVMTTQTIGIHPLFGAFLAGAILPNDILLRSKFVHGIEKVGTLIFLPIFFVYTGIRMHVSLIKGREEWLLCFVIIVLAVVGKMLGSAFAARKTGMSWSESWSLGALMNTRGLMELVVLNIGYDIGMLSPVLFSMMAIMAVVTTLMTSPLLALIQRLYPYETD